MYPVSRGEGWTTSCNDLNIPLIGAWVSRGEGGKRGFFGVRYTG